MTRKEYNIIIDKISNKLNPINQLLYQALILIVFYYIFDTFKNSKKHKSFILLCAVICILLDFCMWNNILQTLLFFAILIIYINYNFYRETSIDTFITTMNQLNNVTKDNIILFWKQEEEEKKNKQEIDKITFVPKKFNSNSNSTLQKKPKPEPYDKSNSAINEINLAYQTDIPHLHITDTNYAHQMLYKLYDTPQYKNIKKNQIDKLLDNDIIYYATNNETNNEINNEINNKINNLFKNPKKIFLDKTWLKNKENTYNYSCVNNKCNKSQKSNKNAICSVVQFGMELSECTNQDNSITSNQLSKISNNEITNELTNEINNEINNELTNEINNKINNELTNEINN